MDETRFIADSMLGKLALWMRLAGFDVIYENRIEDNELIRRAVREDRIILTRDTLLVKRKTLRGRYFFIKSDKFRAQLKEVLSRFKIKKERFLTRCLRCNEPLKDIDKSLIKDKVPEYVYSTQERFTTCLMCQRIYWAGTHKDEMEKEIERILGE